jgi:hypothetical protein
MIKINKRSLQHSSQGSADGGLASTHHTDQKNRTVVTQQACVLRQILRIDRGIQLAGRGGLGRQRFSIHAFIIPLTAQSLKLIRANPRKTFKMIVNEQI